MRICDQELRGKGVPRHEVGQGEDVLEHLKSGSLKPADQTSCFAQYISGIFHMHKHGVVYRDAKPQNFLYDADTKEFLMVDLGLASKNNKTRLKKNRAKTG